MPVGGHDIGCNVWVEGKDVLIYAAQSGAFDNQGRMCKAGRIRITFPVDVFEDCFCQELVLWDGYVKIQGKSKLGNIILLLWCEAKAPVIHISMNADFALDCSVIYENWRMDDKSDIGENQLLFFHENKGPGVFEERIAEQGIGHLTKYFPDVEKNRIFGGCLYSEKLCYDSQIRGHYGENDYTGYVYRISEKTTGAEIMMVLHTGQYENAENWKGALELIGKTAGENQQACEETREWWHSYWERSYVFLKPGEKLLRDKDWQTGRNYQIFRYMLGCNAYGEYPTKFNGSLFTVDPIYCSRREGFGSVCPDDRDWGGLIFTAQNQRLVYWPMLKNGDFSMMKPQFDFYLRLLSAMKKRTEYFFGLENAACFPEQLDANGLSAFYGKYGLDYPLQVRYHHSTALEFAYMMLSYCEFTEEDVTPYLDFTESILNYYDQYYHNKDEKGKRIIFPSTALETFHAEETKKVFGEEGRNVANYNEDDVAVTNPADVIAALQATLEKLVKNKWGSPEQQEKWRQFLQELPDIPREIKNGYEVVAPCEYPREYIIGNCELPQLYPVYPYRIYGVERPESELAKNTYFYSWDIKDQLLHISWHQNGIFAACLGLKEDARKYMWLKLADAERKCPAFWGPGHDYVPDHNWGGSGMIQVQEMLVQTLNDKILLLPAWPNEVNVSFKLWVEKKTWIECNYSEGNVSYHVEPAARAKDVVVCVEGGTHEV